MEKNQELQRVKVLFELVQDHDGYPPVATERLWAVPLGASRYRIDNIPFYARLVADGDVVLATKNVDDELIFNEVVERSGSSTVRIFATKDSDSETLRIALKEMGCATEGSNNKRLFALDIPPSVSYRLVKEVLDTWEKEGLIEYEEACVY